MGAVDSYSACSTQWQGAAHAHVHAHTCCVHTHACVPTHTQVHTHTWACRHAMEYTRVSAHIHACIALTHTTCACAFACTCTHLCVHTWNTHVGVRIHATSRACTCTRHVPTHMPHMYSHTYVHTHTCSHPQAHPHPCTHVHALAPAEFPLGGPAPPPPPPPGGPRPPAATPPTWARHITSLLGPCPFGPRERARMQCLGRVRLSSG